MRRRLYNARVRLAFRILPGPAKFVALGESEGDLVDTLLNTLGVMGPESPNTCEDPDCLCNVETMTEQEPEPWNPDGVQP